MFKFVPTRYYLPRLIGYPILGGVVGLGLFCIFAQLSDITYLLEALKDPRFSSRSLQSLYLLVTTVATSAVFGILTRKFVGWIYRHIPRKINGRNIKDWDINFTQRPAL
jgi:hypothetical protein